MPNYIDDIADTRVSQSVHLRNFQGKIPHQNQYGRRLFVQGNMYTC